MNPTLRRLLPSLLCALGFLIIMTPRYTRAMSMIYPEVRSAAVQAMEGLQRQGVWLLNVELQGIERREADVCITTKHQYRGRALRGETDLDTTCL